ncbi:MULTISPECIES: helix-turn-helix domain-containing protein [unclassified Arsenophonus]|uniref:helix-turn-helix domain-containing protein n=1 Tax=unclassified Arsenophonus TaxID=2627083 RepID=UPI002864D3A7|nr:helix-turn-helix domain-containing protein [Arsenophonus sp.]MDR5611277.1 helix-turn-helix domain-containing protein [Arsenophonus sp.]MDR5615294.1 helix-turn-helix domain-containing protein [Arsenophonus sp.]
MINKNTNNPLSERLNKLIEVKSITKSDMAKICGVTPQSVNGWYIRGSIGKESAIKLADHLNVSVAWLLGEGDASIDDLDLPKPELSEKEKLLLKLFNELPESESNELLKTLTEKKYYYDKLLKELLQKKNINKSL